MSPGSATKAKATETRLPSAWSSGKSTLQNDGQGNLKPQEDWAEEGSRYRSQPPGLGLCLALLGQEDFSNHEVPLSTVAQAECQPALTVDTEGSGIQGQPHHCRFLAARAAGAGITGQEATTLYSSSPQSVSHNTLEVKQPFHRGHR